VKTKLLAALLSVLFVSLLFELGLRLLSRNPYAKEDVDHVVQIRRQHAGMDRSIDRRQIDPALSEVLMRTDERGYLLPSRRHAAPDVTIAFFGGSTTECAAVEEALRFPALVGDLLAAEGIAANTLNAGKSGNTSHDALNLLLNHVVLDRPDVAVLMEAINDIGVLGQAGGYRPRMGGTVVLGDVVRWGLQALSIHSHVAARLREIVTQGSTVQGGRWYRRREVEEEVQARVQSFRASLRAFVGAARGLGITPVLMTQPLSPRTTELTPSWSNPEWQDHFNEVVRQVAAEDGVVLVDLVREIPLSRQDWRDPMKVFYDGVHVSDEGSRLYARVITDRLLETVLAKDRPPAH